MPNFVIANKIELANPHANLDVLYGPYNSIAEAKATVVSVLREKGLTVGVYESGAVVEYWWKAGTTDADLVLKQASVAGAMLEADYTGDGTAQVNYSKYADEAEQSIHSYSADQDALGREIHETYALKQSGVTPPATERVILDDVNTTYEITDITSENLIVQNGATIGGEVILSALAADKSLKILIEEKGVIIDQEIYEAGVTVFAIYEAATSQWTLTSILDPEIPDYSDMTVDVMVDNPTIIPKPGYIRITGSPWMLGTMVFLRTTDTPTPIGIYRCVGAGAGYSNLKLIAAGTVLHTVRVKDGDVWYSQYDGKNAGSLVFKNIQLPRQLTLQSIPTTNEINPSFDKDIFYTENTGTASILIGTFTNMPKYSTTKLIEVLNSRRSTMSITFRTTNLVLEEITYSFVNFSLSTLVLPAGKRAEISYLFKFTDTNICIVELMYSIEP